MAHHDPDSIRNVAVIGHRGAGKTSLVEGMLFAAGATSRRGTVGEGTTVADHDDDERRRGMSISAAVCHADWRGTRVTLIDTPGEPSFHADTVSSLKATDAALVVLNAAAGVEVSTERLWARCERAGLARIVVVNGMDRERASLDAALGGLGELGATPVVLQIPIGTGPDFRGVVDLISLTATLHDGDGPGVTAPVPDDVADEAAGAREALVESIAEADDALIEKYLEGQELTSDDLLQGLREAVRENRIVPVVCTAGERGIGVERLLDALVDLAPSPARAGDLRGTHPETGEPATLTLTSDGPVVAYCFKTVADQFSGRINLLRVVSGTLTGDTQAVCARTGQRERMGHLMRLQGKEHEQVAELGPGEVGAVGKLKDVTTGDLLTVGPAPLVPDPIDYPAAVMSFAVAARDRADEDKVVASLRRLGDEDPTLDLHRDAQTGDLIVAGLSQMHVEVVVERLRRRFGVDVELKPPHIPYRETITAHAKAEGKHKKQSGGRGQYGDCWLEVEPLPRGQGFEFVDRIVGGAIPRAFIPAVEKGVVEAMQHGSIGGFPLVDVRVTLYDGKFHPVDSSEMAFKIAGSLGMKAAVEKARPVLLEPIMTVEVTVPEELVGDVMGDLNSRRGHPLGMEARGHSQVVRAEVPMAMMLSYAVDLRSMTGGRGDYTMELARYEEVPSHLTEKAVEANRAA
jgi:elongation factor G